MPMFNFSYSIHKLICLEVIEVTYYVLGAFIVGVIVGMCVIILRTKKPIVIPQDGGGTGAIDVDKFNKLAKTMNPFNE